MKTVFFAFCSVVWMSLIYYLSTISGDRLGPNTLEVNLIKKFGHMLIFGVLAALYLYTLKGRKTLRETHDAFFLLSLFLALLYSIGDEYHQSFVPGRHSSGKDVVIDVCGAFAAVVILYVVKTREIGKCKEEYCHGKIADRR